MVFAADGEVMRESFRFLVVVAALGAAGVPGAASAQDAGGETPSTNEFLANCQNNWAWCVKAVSESLDADALTRSDSNACTGQAWQGNANDTDNAIASSVIQWLNNHPQERSGRADEGIYNAAVALWPCTR